MAFNEAHHALIPHGGIPGIGVAVVQQAGEADLGATVGIAVNDASATLVATKAELDATRAKLNALITKLEAAGVLVAV